MVAAAPAFSAEGVADFYRGKTLTVVVSTAAGSSNDIYARAIVAHLAKHIPGNPAIVVKNLVGAGGLAGVNQLSQDASAQDGLTIGSTLPTVPFEPFYGNAEARFDPLKMNWLGTPTIDSAVLMTWKIIVDPLELIETGGQAGDETFGFDVDGGEESRHEGDQHAGLEFQEIVTRILVGGGNVADFAACFRVDDEAADLGARAAREEGLRRRVRPRLVACGFQHSTQGFAHSGVVLHDPDRIAERRH